jgi:hypothetical protein
MLANRKSPTALVALGFIATFAAVTQSLAQTPVYTEVEIACLGKEVDIYRYNFIFDERNIITPSGTYHTVEYFEWDTTWYAPEDGSMWVGHGISPGAINGVPGERGVRQFTSHVKLMPVFGDDLPSLQYNLRLKLTANANGEVKVFYSPQSTDDWNIRCVGPEGPKY